MSGPGKHEPAPPKNKRLLRSTFRALRVRTSLVPCALLWGSMSLSGPASSLDLSLNGEATRVQL